MTERWVLSIQVAQRCRGGEARAPCVEKPLNGKAESRTKSIAEYQR